ncbi:EamA family transporter [Candidatus Micrarchaeota archaeon]|nr:EamA family transporter [Candidatus Micrarchaeota archaeon]
MEWYVYALITMLFFSFANITLKTILDPKLKLIETVQNNLPAILPAIMILALAFVVSYVFFLSKLNLPSNLILLIIGFVILATIGFSFLMMATSTGKIAPVTAIVSTSTVMVAILSVIFLKDSLGIREIGGIVFAFIGILLLATK